MRGNHDAQGAFTSMPPWRSVRGICDPRIVITFTSAALLLAVRLRASLGVKETQFVQTLGQGRGRGRIRRNWLVLSSNSKGGQVRLVP